MKKLLSVLIAAAMLAGMAAPAMAQNTETELPQQEVTVADADARAGDKLKITIDKYPSGNINISKNDITDGHPVVTFIVMKDGGTYAPNATVNISDTTNFEVAPASGKFELRIKSGHSLQVQNAAYPVTITAEHQGDTAEKEISIYVKDPDDLDRLKCKPDSLRAAIHQLQPTPPETTAHICDIEPYKMNGNYQGNVQYSVVSAKLEGDAQTDYSSCFGVQDKNGTYELFSDGSITKEGKYTITIEGTSDLGAIRSVDFILEVVGNAATLDRMEFDPVSDTISKGEANPNKILTHIKLIGSDGNSFYGKADCEITAVTLEGQPFDKNKFKVNADEVQISEKLTETGEYRITVTATDKATSKKVEKDFTLTVNDTNPPAQLQGIQISPNSKQLPPDKAKQGELLGTLSAADGQGGAYADVTYEVTGVTLDRAAGDSTAFTVDGTQLKINKDLTQEGVYVITVTGEDTVHQGVEQTTNFTLTVKKAADNTNHSSTSSDRHSSRDDEDRRTPAPKSSCFTGLSRPSSNVSKDGSVNADAVLRKIDEELHGGSKTIAILTENAKTVSASDLRSMANAAKGAKATLMADTVVKGVTEGRLYLDAAKAASLEGNINLAVRTSCTVPESVEKLFCKYYKNKLEVVTLFHNGIFGMPVHVAAKVDLSKMNKDTLKFYRYDRANNTYSQLTNVNYRVDSHGFLHFTTSVGGDIVITDAPLEGK